MFHDFFQKYRFQAVASLTSVSTLAMKSWPQSRSAKPQVPSPLSTVPSQVPCDPGGTRRRRNLHPNRLHQNRCGYSRSHRQNEEYTGSALGEGKNWQCELGEAVQGRLDALFDVYGDDDDLDEDEERTVGQKAYAWSFHVIQLPWKIVFAFIPPTDYCGGWVCFCFSLIFIGLVTAIIGDVAAIFGCCLGIKAMGTAITFVALGTSLPDTFASKTAAQQDPHADASVGNVTGSNSVNVFLGLGMPWTIGAIYWAGGANDEWRRRFGPGSEAQAKIAPEVFPEAFIVQAGDLAFSVTVFSICAVVCVAVLAVRRRLFGGELGGPLPAKIVSAVIMIGLWLIYIGMSFWKMETTDSS
eukprot:s1688_g2.t1